MDVYLNKNILGKVWLIFCFNDARLDIDLSLFSVIMLSLHANIKNVNLFSVIHELVSQ